MVIHASSPDAWSLAATPCLRYTDALRTGALAMMGFSAAVVGLAHTCPQAPWRCIETSLAMRPEGDIWQSSSVRGPGSASHAPSSPQPLHAHAPNPPVSPPVAGLVAVSQNCSVTTPALAHQQWPTGPHGWQLCSHLYATPSMDVPCPPMLLLALTDP